MKKALFIFMAIALITPMIFAYGPAPEVTFGGSASVEVQALKANTTDTFEKSGTKNTPKASFNPFGTEKANFVTNQWVDLDWDVFSVKADAKYDAFRASADDYSWLKVTATWKDLFGFNVAYEYVQDNKEGKADPTEALAKNTGNNVILTYDHLEDNGVKFWTKYSAVSALGLNITTPLAHFNTLAAGFTEIGFQYDNDEIATKIVYKGSKEIDAATIEAKNMFGFWTVLLNDADEIGYRLDDLDSGSNIDRPGFKIGKDNKIQSADVAKKAMNAKNTFAIGENLKIKATAVVPNETEDKLVDWLAGKNLLVGAELAVDGVGTLGAGAKVSNDYVVSTGEFSGPKKVLAQFSAGTNEIQWGNAFWFDAKLDQLLGESMKAFASVDAQLGQYLQTYKTIDSDKDGKVAEGVVGTATKVNLYGEFAADLSDALSVSAGVLYSLGMGYDHKAITNYSWSDQNKEVEGTFYNGFTEDNVHNATIYGIKPFELKAKATFKVNDGIKVWASDNFVANAGYLGEKDADGESVYKQFSFAGAKVINEYAFFQKNVLGLGAEFAASENAKLTVSTDINFYLGLPTASDLETKAVTDAKQGEALKTAHAEWKSQNFNPFTVKVAYSYAY